MKGSFTATVAWERDGAAFTDGRYGRGHRWLFDGGIEVAASSAPSSVPLPYSREDAVDPEEAFVAALSSCHMLFFLRFAAQRGFVVDSYRDEATGTMSQNEAGRLFMSAVTLAPALTFAGDPGPSAGEIEDMHHAAHDACYLANSVRTVVTVVARPPS